MTNEGTPLGEIFDAPAAPTPAAPAPKVETPETKPAAAPITGEKDKSVTPPVTPDPETVPFAAVKDERARRQAAEAELAKVKAEIEASRKAAEVPKADPAPEPLGFYDDPEGFIARQVEQAQRALKAQMVDASEMRMRESKPDYAEAEAAFMEVAKANPALARQAMDSPDAARFIYDHGKRLHASAAMNTDPEAYRAKVEAEVRAKIEAEAKAKADEEARIADAAKPSLNSQARDTSGRFKPPAFAGPTPLGDILG